AGGRRGRLTSLVALLAGRRPCQGFHPRPERAGVSKAARIEDTTVEDFDRLFAINVQAPFFLVQQLLPILGSGASIVFLSSLAAHAVVGLLPAYGAAKGAIETMTRYFASLLGE